MRYDMQYDNSDEEDDLRGLVRAEDHSTSIEAANKVLKDMALIREQVKRMFMTAYPACLTDYQVEEQGHAIKRRGNGTYRRRRTDLSQLGFLDEMGRRKDEDGSPRKFYRLTEQAKRVFLDNEPIDYAMSVKILRGMAEMAAKARKAKKKACE